jgi:hypothetical protein
VADVKTALVATAIASTMMVAACVLIFALSFEPYSNIFYPGYVATRWLYRVGAVDALDSSGDLAFQGIACVFGLNWFLWFGLFYVVLATAKGLRTPNAT